MEEDSPNTGTVGGLQTMQNSTVLTTVWEKKRKGKLNLTPERN